MAVKTRNFEASILFSSNECHNQVTVALSRSDHLESHPESEAQTLGSIAFVAI